MKRENEKKTYYVAYTFGAAIPVKASDEEEARNDG